MPAENRGQMRCSPAPSRHSEPHRALSGSPFQLCTVPGCMVCMVHPDIGPESGPSFLLLSCLPLPGNPLRHARQQPACVMRVHAPEHRPSAASSPCRGSICSRTPGVDKKGRRREPSPAFAASRPAFVAGRRSRIETNLGQCHPAFRCFGVAGSKRRHGDDRELLWFESWW